MQREPERAQLLPVRALRELRLPAGLALRPPRRQQGALLCSALQCQYSTNTSAVSPPADAVAFALPEIPRDLEIG